MHKHCSQTWPVLPGSWRVGARGCQKSNPGRSGHQAEYARRYEGKNLHSAWGQFRFGGAGRKNRLTHTGTYHCVAVAFRNFYDGHSHTICLDFGDLKPFEFTHGHVHGFGSAGSDSVSNRNAGWFTESLTLLPGQRGCRGSEKIRAAGQAGAWRNRSRPFSPRESPMWAKSGRP